MKTNLMQKLRKMVKQQGYNPVFSYLKRYLESLMTLFDYVLKILIMKVKKPDIGVL